MITLPIMVKHGVVIKEGEFLRPSPVNGRQPIPEDITYPVSCTVQCDGLLVDQSARLLFTQYTMPSELTAVSLIVEDVQFTWPHVNGEPTNTLYIGSTKDHGMQNIMAILEDYDDESGLRIKELRVGNSQTGFVPLADCGRQTLFTEAQLERVLIFANSCLLGLLAHNKVTFAKAIERWKVTKSDS